MGSDRSRRSYDESRQYRRVVPQQGRVVVEADGNEAQEIITEEIRKEAMDMVGPAGTPDDGYKVTVPQDPEIPYDFWIGPGTMYVGGMRVSLATETDYFVQPDWYQDLPNQNPGPPAPQNPTLEHVYLYLHEQEVSAVEDTALREVALGGPDTAQRTRLIQRIKRTPVMSNNCAGAMGQTIAAWESKGLYFDAKTMRLGSHTKLQVTFAAPPDPVNLCAPEVLSGYLGAENQLLRVQVAAPATPDGAPDKLLWAFDNASALYRVADVKLIDQAELLVAIDLAEAPVDAHHFPRVGQLVEGLDRAVQLGPNGAEGHIANPTGRLYSIVSDYDPANRRIIVKLPDVTGGAPRFVRIWEERLDLTADTPIALGSTGVRVTLSKPAGKPFVAGDHWLIGVRPKTPELVYPRRLLDAPQPPDGPREWVCPLAVLQWTGASGVVLEDCRQQFENLVALSKKPPGCCTVTLSPRDLANGATLQSIIDAHVPVLEAGGCVKVCLRAGEYAMSGPLRLASQHAGLRVEGCGGEVKLVAASGAGNAFLDGMIVITETENIWLRGLVFAPPNVDFDTAGGLLAGHTTLALYTASSGNVDFRRLTVSVGLRVFSSSNIHVHGCTFVLATSAPAGPKSFYAGVFAAGSYRETLPGPPEVVVTRALALDVQGCLFTSRTVPESSNHHMFGVLVTPSTTFQLSLLNTITSGTLVQPVIDDVTFRDNTFTNLTSAVFLSAETGLVRFEDNTVKGCYAGFWSVSLHALARTDDELATRLTHVSPATPSVSVSQVTALRNDPVVTIGSAVARAYPPPQGWTSSSATPIDPASGPLDSLHHALAAVERVFDNRDLFPTILCLDLCVSNNDIDTRSASGFSAAALALWDTEPGPQNNSGHPKLHPGEARLSNNRLMGNSSFVTALVVMVLRCTVTGNVVTNESTPNETIYSLNVLGQDMPARVAVTGNVLTQLASLPNRSDLSAPAWATLNSYEPREEL